jgi:hypothetical protein
LSAEVKLLTGNGLLLFRSLKMVTMNQRSRCVRTIPVLFLLCLSTINGCKQWVNEKADTLVMENVLGRVADAFEDGNMDALRGLIVRDRTLFVVGPNRDEVYTGWVEVEQKINVLLASVEQLEIDVTERRISPGIDERTAYFLQTADVTGTGKERPFTLQGVRVTGVMERHGGRWVIVFAHISGAVGDIKGSDLNIEMRL